MTNIEIGLAIAIVGAGGTLATLGVIVVGIALLHRLFPPEPADAEPKQP